jgi:hypothetical protein
MYGVAPGGPEVDGAAERAPPVRADRPMCCGRRLLSVPLIRELLKPEARAITNVKLVPWLLADE